MLKGQCSEINLAESGTSIDGFLYNGEARIFSADLPIPSHIRVPLEFHVSLGIYKIIALSDKNMHNSVQKFIIFFNISNY
jgi:hypothetical protein